MGVSLNSSAEQYYNCLNRFAVTCSSMGNSIVSVIVCGSLAIGDLRPCANDTPGVVVVLHDDVLQNRDKHEHVMAVLQNALQEISSSGLSFQSFHYLTISEIRQGYWYVYLPILMSARYCRVVYGDDVRSQAPSVEVSGPFLRAAFFGARWTLFRGFESSNLNRSPAALLDRVRWFVRTVPKIACLMFGVCTDYPEVFETLCSLFPNLDVDRFRALDVFFQQPVSRAAEFDTVWIVQELTALYEELRCAVTMRLTREGRGPTFVGELFGEDSR